MDKNVKYLLLGAGALVLGAVAIHFMTKESDDEETVDDVLQRKIQELLPVEKDAMGMISFEKFLKIFEICAVYGKSKFADKKR